MKKLYFFLLYILLCNPLFSQISDQIEFDFQQLKFTTVDSFTKISFNDCSFTEEAGAPQLPYMVMRYIIPSDKNVSSVTLNNNISQTVPGIFLVYPSQPDYPIDQPSPAFVALGQTAYTSDIPYPGERVKIADQYYDKGYHIVTLHIFPLSYIPASRSLQLYTSFQFTLHYEDADILPIKPKIQSQAMYDIAQNQIRSLVKNKNSSDLFTEGNTSIVPANAPVAVPGILNSSDILPEYLIITNNTDVDGNPVALQDTKSMTQIFQELADWKTKKGIPTVVISLDEIKEQYLGADVQEKIHNFLKEVYQNYGRMYVLFGGDVNIIPARMVKNIYYPNPEPERLFPTDLYYTAIEKSWNANGDAMYGELVDQCDFTSEFYYGRAPVKNGQDARVFTKKVMEYEKLSAVSDKNYINNALFIASYLVYDPPRIDESMTTVNAVADAITQSNITKWKVYDHPESYGGDALLNKENALHYLNTGTETGNFHLVYHIDHSGYSTMGASSKIQHQDLMRTDMDALFNAPYHQILYTNSCHPGEFHKDCIIEHYLNNPDGGGVAVIASSATSREFECTNHFGKFTRDIYETSTHVPRNYNIGVVHDKSIPSDQGYRFYKRKNHLFGDPEMPIWTREPETLTVSVSPSTLSNTNNQIQVTVGNMVYSDPVTVCVMKDKEIYLRQSGVGNPASKTFTFTIEPETAGTLHITVTGHNYLPVERQIPVQITGKNIYIADKVVVDTPDGNHNNIPEAGETVNLAISLKNNGTLPVNAVSAILRCSSLNPALPIDDILTISTDSVFIASISAGSTQTIDNYQFSINKDVPDGTPVYFTLFISDNAGYHVSRNFSYRIKAPDLVHVENKYSITNNEYSLRVGVNNLGEGKAMGVTATLSSDSPDITIINSMAEYGDIHFLETKQNSNPFTFYLNQAYDEQNLTVTLTDVYGKTWQKNINLSAPVRAIENLAFTGTQQSITLTWDPILNIKGYNVYRNHTEEGSYIRLNAFPFSTASTYTDNGLSIMATFYYKVSFIDLNGNESALYPITAWTTLPYRAGWPVVNNADNLGDRNEGSPQAYDINGDGYDELFFTQYSHSLKNRGGIFAFTHLGEEVYDIDHNPTTISGFADIGAQVKSTPALADIDHDGIIEIVVTTMVADVDNAAKVHVYKTSQNQDRRPDFYWTAYCGHTIYGASIAPFSGDAGSLGCFPSKSWNYPVDVIPVLNHDGSLYQNLSLDGTTKNDFMGDLSIAAVADLDNNGTIEIVIGYPSGLYLYEKNSSGEYQLKWSYKNSSYPDMASPVVVADLDGDGDLEILFVMKSGSTRMVCAKHHNGDFVTNWGVNNQSHSIPSDDSWLSVGDLDRDGYPEVVIGSLGKIYAWKKDGNIMPHFPIHVPGLSMPERAPLIADIDGYNDTELILASENGGIYAYKADGTPVLGFPLNAKVHTPCIADIDHDGKNEIIAAGKMTFHVWNTEGDSRYIEWGRVRFDERNTGAYRKKECEITGTLEITGQELWDTHHTLNKNIEILPGKTLTITSTVYMPSSGKIIVRPGGKLILDGGKLTSACGDFWQGITVLGDDSREQVDSKQGVLELKNGAIIENALTGVLVGLTGNRNMQNGGIIRASDAYFINCPTGVEIMPYVSKARNLYEPGNRSSFTSCHFIWNKEMNPIGGGINPKPLSHVILAGTGAIPFRGCHFVNDRFTDRVTHGIYAADAKIEVNARIEQGVYPPKILEKSNFDGFIYGIRTEKAIPSVNRYAKVEYTDFNNNAIGIFNNGVDNSIFRYNIFKIGNPPGVLYAPNEPYTHEQQQYSKSPVFNFEFGTGITLNESTGYDIRFNYFSRIQAPVYLPIGMLVKNSGKASNEIKSNTFDSLYTAILCNGNNQSPDGMSGLQIVCNTFGGNTEFAIQIDNTGNGIAWYQGQSNKSAGNTFRQSNPKELGHIWNASERAIGYFHNQNRSDETPWQISEQVNLFPTSSAGACAFASPITYSRADLQVAESEFVNIKYNYNNRIDGGSTNQLLTELELSWNKEAWEIRDNLIQKSPYLSETIIREVAEKSLLPHAMLLEVCLANPDATRSPKLIDFLKEGIPDPMPGYMCELIVANQDAKTFRTVLEASMNAAESNLEITARNMINTYSEDSTEYSANAMLQIFERLPNIEAVLSLADLYASQGEWVISGALLDNLQDMKLEDLEKLEIEKLSDWYAFMGHWQPHDSTLLTNQEVDKITMAYLSSDSKASERVRSLLYRHSKCDYNYHIEPNIPSTGKTKAKRRNIQALLNEMYNSVTVQPNPAETFTTFSYELQADVINSTLLITDSKGTHIVSAPLSGSQGHYVWDTRTIASGIYSYVLVFDGKLLATGKIIVKK